MVRIKIPETVIQHIPEILTGANAIGVVVTAWLTGKAAIRAHDAVEKELPAKEKFKRTWHHFVLPATVGVATIASGIASNRVSAKRLAEMTAVAALYADRVKALEGKVEEKFGKDKLGEMKSEMKDEQLVQLSNDQKMLCYEPVSKQYFKASQQELMMAELTANKIFHDNGEISMNKFLTLLPDCKPYKGGDQEGWWFTDEDGEADFNWSFYGRAGRPAAPWVDIQPQISKKNGRPVLRIAYGMWPMSKKEWMEGDTNGLLRESAGKENA